MLPSASQLSKSQLEVSEMVGLRPGVTDANGDKVQAWGTALSMTRAFLELVMRRQADQDDWSLQAAGVERHFPEAWHLPGSNPTDQPWTADFLDPWLGLMGSRSS